MHLTSLVRPTLAALTLAATMSCKTAGGGSAVLASAPDANAATLSPAQAFERSAPLFNDQVNSIHIYLTHDDFNGMLGEACNKVRPLHLVRRIEVFLAGHDQPEVVANGGIKVRGNTSCGNPRKQYGLSFGFKKPAGGAPATLLGLSAIGLRSSENDRSRLREKLASEVFAFGDELSRRRGLAGAAARGGSVYRVGFAHLYVHLDGDAPQHFGLFNTAEVVNAEMFARRFGGDTVSDAFEVDQALGTFKPQSAAPAQVFTAYAPELLAGRKFDDKDDQQRAAFQKLIGDFITRVGQAKSAQDLRAFLDIDSFLNYLAAANLVGHWDSMVGNANNDYLVFDKARGKWQIVVWDLDNTFGTDSTRTAGFDGCWTQPFDQFRLGATDLLAGNERPLFKKIMQYFGPEYAATMRSFTDAKGIFDHQRIQRRIEFLRDQVVMKEQGDPSRRDADIPADKFDDTFQNVFRFMNHRVAFAGCSLQKKRPQMDADSPRFQADGALSCM